MKKSEPKKPEKLTTAEQEIKKHKPKKKSVLGKLFFWAVLIALIIAAYYIFEEQIFQLLQKNPTVWLIYQHISEQIANTTLLGLLYISFLGSLFFILIPSEAVFLYYNSAAGHAPEEIITVALIGAVLGQLINYLIGRLIGPSILQRIIKDHYNKFNSVVNRFGGIITLFGNIIPFPIEPVTLIIGASKYPLKRFLFYTTAGRLAKFLILVGAGNYILSFF